MGLPSSCGISVGRLPKGAKNLITDVRGVQVGHCTLARGDIHTGVSVVLPHQDNLFREKVLAAACVLNGFGKTTGLVQIEELGTIESPIALTNTLSVGTVWEALVKVLLEQNPDIGVRTGTVNPLVAECNDGRLNDIRGLHVQENHLREALASASCDFAEGSVGAGTGMVCLGFKGGIGSSSRLLRAAGQEWTLGALVLSNFGAKGNLTINAKRIHPGHTQPSTSTFPSSVDQENLACRAASAAQRTDAPPVEHTPMCMDTDQGSIIIVLATDLPLNERQLKRAARRSAVGLSRTGSLLGNGSGDICIAFSTAHRLPHDNPKELLPLQMLHEEEMDLVFEATVEAVEESIISSLWHATDTIGIRGYHAPALADCWKPAGLD